ncbi:hypothetical protein IF2G_07880 [Cordyceps javanica]|nr:hypothetical protein IF2G_07880 [Cordyceps javanica]
MRICVRTSGQRGPPHVQARAIYCLWVAGRTTMGMPVTKWTGKCFPMREVHLKTTRRDDYDECSNADGLNCQKKERLDTI